MSLSVSASDFPHSCAPSDATRVEVETDTGSLDCCPCALFSPPCPLAADALAGKLTSWKQGSAGNWLVRAPFRRQRGRRSQIATEGSLALATRTTHTPFQNHTDNTQPPFSASAQPQRSANACRALLSSLTAARCRLPSSACRGQTPRYSFTCIFF